MGASADAQDHDANAIPFFLLRQIDLSQPPMEGGAKAA
jgi:hypothetical protein